MKKRFLPLALSLAVTLSLFPIPAHGAEVTVTEAIPLQFDDVRDFSEGLAMVRDKIDGEVKWGYIDMEGNVVIPYQFSGEQSFSEGLAAVQGGEEYEWNWGYIDKTGQVVIPRKYEYVYGFSGGMAKVQLDNKWGFIDTEGNEVIPCKYTWAADFSEGLAAVADEEKGQGFIDKTGKEVVPLGKYTVFQPFSEGLAKVKDKKNNRECYIDKTGEAVIPCQYESAGAFFEGLAAVRNDDLKWGYIDKTGELVIPCIYDWAEDFSEGMAAVKLNGAWGYIDKTGREVIPCKYESVSAFSGGIAIVWRGDVPQGSLYQKCIIDKKGQEVFYLGEYGDLGAFSEGMLAVGSKNYDGWGFLSINVTEEPETPPVTPETPDVASETPAALAYASTQSVLVDGKAVEFQCYALKDADGNDTNYIKLRDVASVLSGTSAQFDVGWDGAVNIETGRGYTPNGSEMHTPFFGDRAYENAAAPTNVNGVPAALEAIVLKDDQGGAFTYYKLRDLGAALGFRVDWSAQTGIFIETK